MISENTLEIIKVILAEFSKKINHLENQYFVNKSNKYRNEDGRPICYCCPRVRHIAKYCWDRKFSCVHRKQYQPRVYPEISSLSCPSQRSTYQPNPYLVQKLTTPDNRQHQLLNDIQAKIQKLRNFQAELDQNSPRLEPSFTVPTPAATSIPSIPNHPYQQIPKEDLIAQAQTKVFPQPRNNVSCQSSYIPSRAYHSNFQSSYVPVNNCEIT